MFSLALEPEEGALLHWLYEETEVMDRRVDENGRTLIVVRVMPEKEARLLKRFPSARPLRRSGTAALA